MARNRKLMQYGEKEFITFLNEIGKITIDGVEPPDARSRLSITVEHILRFTHNCSRIIEAVIIDDHNWPRQRIFDGNPVLYERAGTRFYFQILQDDFLLYMIFTIEDKEDEFILVPYHRTGIPEFVGAPDLDSQKHVCVKTAVRSSLLAKLVAESMPRRSHFEKEVIFCELTIDDEDLANAIRASLAQSFYDFVPEDIKPETEAIDKPTYFVQLVEFYLRGRCLSEFNPPEQNWRYDLYNAQKIAFKFNNVQIAFSAVLDGVSSFFYLLYWTGTGDFLISYKISVNILPTLKNEAKDKCEDNYRFCYLASLLNASLRKCSKLASKKTSESTASSASSTSSKSTPAVVMVPRDVFVHEWLKNQANITPAPDVRELMDMQ